MTPAMACAARGIALLASLIAATASSAQVQAGLGMASSSAATAASAASAASAALPAPASAALFRGAPRNGDRFVNLDPFELPTPADLIDWYWSWTLAGGTRPPPGGYESIPVLRPDLGWLRANRSETTVTWVGHSTVLLQLGGLNVITDPQFSRRASPFRFVGPERKVAVPFTLDDGPRIDVVLISHNHYDHLDGDSIDALARQPGGPPLFIVPLGVDRWMRERGIERVAALDWWGVRELPDAGAGGARLRITMVPARHWSSRSPADRFETLWGGYVVERISTTPTEAVDYRFFFAGDTGYAPLFRDMIHARFDHFDFAAIPIGAYEPNRYLKAQHVTPEEAVLIHRDLDIRQSMAIHWGTFVLTTEPFDQPPKDLARALERAHLPPEAFVTFRHGEMRILEKNRRAVSRSN